VEQRLRWLVAQNRCQGSGRVGSELRDTAVHAEGSCSTRVVSCPRALQGYWSHCTPLRRLAVVSGAAQRSRG
jgi:hypothetical protein